MKKKLIFFAYDMRLGGIEKALVNLLNKLDYDKYDVTLVLERKEGIFFDMIPKQVKILEYKIYDDKFVLKRKIKNRIKLLNFKRQINNKYDFSCSFATYSIPNSHLALCASSNNVIWMHANYYVTYDKDELKLKRFLDSISVKRFKKIVFVSEENKREVCKHYSGILDKSIVCNNFINGHEIIEKSKEKCDLKKDIYPLFVNVGRHEEHQKRLTRIINASKKLVSEGYKFHVLLVGDGPDNKKYIDMVNNNNLGDIIEFAGKKQNPYPYFKIADAILLSSEYEGYPVVFLESMVLNKPLLSTRVSDYETLENKFGLFDECSEDGVYRNMKKFIENGFEIAEKFDYEEFNLNIKKKIYNLIEDK